MWLLFIQYYPTDDANQRFRNAEMSQERPAKMEYQQSLGVLREGGLCSLKGPEGVGQTETGNWYGSKDRCSLYREGDGARPARQGLWERLMRGPPRGGRILQVAAA